MMHSTHCPCRCTPSAGCTIIANSMHSSCRMHDHRELDAQLLPDARSATLITNSSTSRTSTNTMNSSRLLHELERRTPTRHRRSRTDQLRLERAATTERTQTVARSRSIQLHNFGFTHPIQQLQQADLCAIRYSMYHQTIKQGAHAKQSQHLQCLHHPPSQPIVHTLPAQSVAIVNHEKAHSLLHAQNRASTVLYSSNIHSIVARNTKGLLNSAITPVE